jgi:hypothetical protein
MFNWIQVNSTLGTYRRPIWDLDLGGKNCGNSQYGIPKYPRRVKYFLDLARFHRQFVPFYALRAAPLRRLATNLTKNIRKADQKRAVKSDAVKVSTPTKEQMESFEQLKEGLSSEQLLAHDDSHVPLMIAVDVSYEFGFGVTVYQVLACTKEGNNITAEQIQSGDYDRRMDRAVVFISKELTPAEILDWPTELKTAAVVFAVKKGRHLVEANDFPTVVYTDHVAVKQISHSTSLKTTSPG